MDLRKHLQEIDIENPDLEALAARVKDAKVVLLGEATHGTKEFYELRAKISMHLIENHGFNLVCLEADWPDADGINSYVHERAKSWHGFDRFPTWMWRNRSFSRFADQLRTYNAREHAPKVSVCGLDLYSLSRSLEVVSEFFMKQDPMAREKMIHARECLEPWHEDPSHYGLAVWRETIAGCEREVLDLLRDVSERQFADMKASNHELFSVFQNARVLKSAEEYYRIMYGDSIDSWNLRDQHMFDTLRLLLQFHGPHAKALVWEHNSHIGNARATQMGALGEHNVGQLCKDAFGDRAYAIGFLTNRGTVAAASHWDGAMEIKELRPVREDSYEHVLLEQGLGSFFLPLRGLPPKVTEELNQPRLERAVGVLYLPSTERTSHYFRTSLAKQFDEVCWIEKTNAVVPLDHARPREEADTYPFGL